MHHQSSCTGDTLLIHLGHRSPHAMPTKKKRINVTLGKESALFLKEIALRDDVPEATKAAELIEMAMVIEEDMYFSKIADKRDAKNAKFISHKEFWSKLL
jgi:hypothetical protein